MSYYTIDTLIDWYEETGATLGDLDHELNNTYAHLNLNLYDFLQIPGVEQNEC